MSFEIWIIVTVIASGVAAGLGFYFARRGAPSQAEVDRLAAELQEARQQAESVQSNVSEHFEQSAVLFGKLANDYREFLEHFSSSAQALGLSESRARELLEQGYQPLLTQESALEADPAEIDTGAVTESAVEPETVAASAADSVTEVEPVTASQEPELEEPEPPLIEDAITPLPEPAATVSDVTVDELIVDDKQADATLKTETHRQTGS